MTDVLTPEQRRLNMSRIRGRDTKPELLLRRGLHARGLRYRVHRRDLPGSPDIVLRALPAQLSWFTAASGMAMIARCSGCPRHGGNSGKLRSPPTWTGMRGIFASLAAAGWRVLVVWECALKELGRHPLEAILTTIVAWLDTNDPRGAHQGWAAI